MKKFLLPIFLILILLLPAGFCATDVWPPVEKSYENNNPQAPRVLVAYATRAGSTAEIADAIGKKLAEGGAAVDVKPVEKVQSMEGYGAVMLGSAIRKGKPLPEMTDFVRDRKDELKRIPVAYFVVCLVVRENTPENQAKANSYLDGLRREVTPVDTAVFAGKMDYSRIDFFDKLVIKYIIGMPECDMRDWPKIDEWAAALLPKLINTNLIPIIALAAPQDAERFTHIAGVNLSDLPSLENLQRIFGPSSIIESGDAGDYDARICYRTSDKKAIVEFFHGEVNWGFVIRTPKKDDDKCPISEKLHMGGLSIAGVSLGMDKSKYRQIMGNPNKQTSSSLENYFEYGHTLTDAELKQMVERSRKNGYQISTLEDLRRWDVGISTIAIFTKGRLTSFTVSRTETN